MSGKSNLKPIRSVGEAREKGKKGGIASGLVRAKRATLRQTLLTLLETNVTTPFSKDKMPADQALAFGQIIKAVNGDTSAAVFVRDTIGEKPKDVVDANLSIPVIIDDLSTPEAKRGKRKAK
ncbi:MAG: hypothetical protein Q4P84_00140 [Elusimicrobiales bacterium]|nr:hypothetical protein [Elusimicrobiales bacterium]